MADSKQMTIDTIDRQRKYVEQQKEKGAGLGVVFADAFLRGMRDLGYKNPAWALAEQLDNAFQAAADTVSIRLGFDVSNKSRAKPDKIAICDNGNGMIRDMISYAVRWGGTDREGDRNGFGRYGYGLPSSAVSLAKRYTVYSRAAGDKWYAVTVDIEELAAAAGSIEDTEKLLSARPEAPPQWVGKTSSDGDKLDIGSLKSGTIIVLEDLDRLRTLTGWIMRDTLRTKLLQHFGVIYRHWIPRNRIVVDGVPAQAVDPLFLMEHGRLFDETPVRAQRIETRTFEVETERSTKGTVSIRAALLPPNFQLVEPAQYGVKGAKNNKRFDIMKAYNGLLICREHRQIDCIPPKWTKFQNLDANIKVEIDFDPELDEYFGMTTSKQQIVIEDDMWEKLYGDGKNCGAVGALIETMRREFDKQKQELKAKLDSRTNKEAPRPSAAAMEESEKFKGATPEPTPEQRTEGSTNLEEEAAARAEATGEPKEKVRQRLTDEIAGRRFEVEFAAIPEGPFYRPKRLGEQKRLIVNTDHPFYTKIYDVAPEVKAALEVLLFVLAEGELDAKGDTETFYRAERQRWSERLRHALDNLVADEAMIDKAAAVAERMHAAAEAAPDAA